MKLNHSFLIISIAAALIILGVGIALGLRFGLLPGLVTGVGAFIILIVAMLIVNSRQK